MSSLNLKRVDNSIWLESLYHIDGSSRICTVVMIRRLRALIEKKNIRLYEFWFTLIYWGNFSNRCCVVRIESSLSYDLKRRLIGYMLGIVVM